VAAPTAGLHFTPELLQACQDRGAAIATVTLHVGLGTFRPVTAARLSEHRMHGEWCEVAEETAATIRTVQSTGGRVVAVGTTTVRTLETAAASGEVRGWRGETDLFVRPPYAFRAVDALLTNFHLPRSTLLVLVSTFAGRELMRRAYAEAIAERYRFYSYGDAMFIE
jgi:S-adenosylmethionine:tRNA ribosyltransferase-isomerase